MLVTVKDDTQTLSIMQKAFHDKTMLAAAFRRLLFEASPELEKIATKLHLQPEPLNDKLHQVMQASIYTWTEDQVREKLSGVVQEYLYLDMLNNVIGKDSHSVEEARRELQNLFRFFRLSVEAVEKLNLPWYPAMKILRKVAWQGIAHEAIEEQTQEIDVLGQYGKEAMSALRDAKPVLSRILDSRGLECTGDELDTIYNGLKDMTHDTSMVQFENALNAQTGRINMARNRLLLKNKWTTLTGEDTVKSWCVTHKAPIQWIVPNQCRKAIETVIEVQQNGRTVDQQVVNALELLGTLDAGLLTDDQRIQAALIDAIGAEFEAIWRAEGDALLSKARMKNGADMSLWSVTELVTVQRMLKEAQQEKAKKEKLSVAKQQVRLMDDSVLRNRVSAFLDAHPEYCDSFM